MLDRRSVLAGLAGLAAARPAFAEDSPIAHGVLANNRLAKAFEKPRRTKLPDVTLLGPDGTFETSSLKGRTILMPLWAEWCAPCLSEIPDFGKLQKKYANAKFTILPVLTAPTHKMYPANIAQLFAVLHAEALPPVVEVNFGNMLLRTMCSTGGQRSLPCNLLIAPDGTVVGREMGRITADDANAGPKPEKTKDAETVTRAINGQAQSVWGKAEGEELAAALAAGFLG